MDFWDKVMLQRCFSDIHKAKYKSLLTALLNFAAAVVVLLITWEISIKSFDIQGKRSILGINNEAKQIQAEIKTTLPTPARKCNLYGVCPPQHFAVHVRSGAANIVGPKICFDGKIIMSQVLNNVGPGLNIVIINSENGDVEKSAYLNMKAGNPEDILAYLQAIKPGMIVIAASFDDVTTKMTSEMREIFVGMGSTLIQSVKYRDNWVFVGRGGMGNRSSFEKQAPHDAKTNLYEGWPMMVEVGGCFPRS
ncbi:protein FAM3C [Aulostomus maculatus]